MPLPKPDFHALLDQLGAMPARDRNAVLRRLPAPERARIRQLLLGQPPRAAESPYSSEIAARIASLGKAKGNAMTDAGRDALAGILDLPPGKVAAPAARRGASLADTIGGLLRPRAAS